MGAILQYGLSVTLVGIGTVFVGLVILIALIKVLEIAINAATFVGCHAAGLWGAVCATFGVVLPSFLIILLISLFLRQFESLRLVQYAFVGIRAAVLALVLSAVWKLARQTRRTVFSLCIAAAVFALAVFVPQVDVLWLIAASAAAGILLQVIRTGKERRKK